MFHLSHSLSYIVAYVFFIESMRMKLNTESRVCWLCPGWGEAVVLVSTNKSCQDCSQCRSRSTLCLAWYLHSKTFAWQHGSLHSQALPLQFWPDACGHSCRHTREDRWALYFQ